MEQEQDTVDEAENSDEQERLFSSYLWHLNRPKDSGGQQYPKETPKSSKSHRSDLNELIAKSKALEKGLNG